MSKMSEIDAVKRAADISYGGVGLDESYLDLNNQWVSMTAHDFLINKRNEEIKSLKDLIRRVLNGEAHLLDDLRKALD